jgi:NAD(P)H-dependent FMN reductase
VNILLYKFVQSVCVVIKMQVLGLVGSPRKDGRTNRLVDAALEGAQSKGASTTKIYLVDYEIQPFKGRGGSTDAYRNCPEALSRLCEDADALVLGAPVYWGDINGLTKDFMDTVRISTSSGKPALGIAIAGGSGKGLISGVQSIYHFFFHKQMRGIDPAPVSRFNLDAAVAQLPESGGRLVDLAAKAEPFAGASWDDRWPDVMAYYTTVPYFDCGPLDEFVMLARQLITTSKGQDVAQAKAELDTALALIADGMRDEAARHAVRSYQLLFYSP